MDGTIWSAYRDRDSYLTVVCYSVHFFYWGTSGSVVCLFNYWNTRKVSLLVFKVLIPKLVFCKKYP